MTRPACIGLVILLATLTGCVGEQGVTPQENQSFSFCKYVQYKSEVGEGGRAYSVTGCPTILLSSEEAVNQEVRVPGNSTGLEFTFTIDLAEPFMGAEILANNGTTVLLEDQVQFIGGEPVSYEGNDPDLDNRTRTTELVLSACNATKLSLDWGPMPTIGARVEVRSFDTERKAEAIDSGAATCNLYWGEA